MPLSNRARFCLFVLLACLAGLAGTLIAAPKRMENLGRGVIAIRTSTTQVHVSWRLLGTETDAVAFNLYRSVGGAAATKLNASPLTATTDYRDTPPSFASGLAYFVRPVIGGVEQEASTAFTLPPNAVAQPFLSIPIEAPSGGVTPAAESYTYSANDLAPADLDGDGEYELVVKWDPSNAKDNSQSGYTGNVYLDGYKLDGTRLWRIDLGKNIRAGAHYTQFIAYDLDSDGRAEIACKTAPGTRDGKGAAVLMPGDSADADYRNSSGYILSGPEYLTVFDGLTGAALATTAYLPGRGTVSTWGDSYGNRVDRFLAGVAYLDGERPSLIMARGYYTKTHVVAWDWRDRALTQRWAFFADNNTAYAGQGNHQLSVADVDADGKQEIIYGSMALDDNGTGLYSTGLGHGDALHVSDFDPARPGLEVFAIHEDMGSSGNRGSTFRDAATGVIIWSTPATGDTGRGVIGDLDPNHLGAEAWNSSDGNIYTVAGAIAGAKPSNMEQNFMVWWDADLERELLNGSVVTNFNYSGYGRQNILLAYNYGAESNNGTKSTPGLSGDILGDWREEIVWRNADSTALLLFTPTSSATNRLRTLAHDPQYRVALAWQNVGYNQPPHPSFFIGQGMSAPPMPDITTEPIALPREPLAVRWTGATSATWDGASPNFITVPGGEAVSFVAGDAVTIDDSSATATIHVGVSVAPSALLVDTAIARSLGGSGGIGGAGTLTKSGSGALTLTSANTYAGGTMLTSGTLTLGNASALGSGPVTLRGGVLATGALTPPNAIVVDGVATITGGNSGGTHGIKAVSGSGVLTLDATNVFDLEGSFAAYAGRVLFAGTGSFRFFGGAGSSTAAFALGTRTLSARSGAAFTLGSLSGDAGAVLSGASGGGNTTAVAYTVGSNGTDTAFAGVIANGGGATSLVKTGAGRLVLSGASTYTGATTVSAGRLIVTGSLGATAVSVASGATIGGGGSIGGALTLANGARLALGVAPGGVSGPIVNGATTLNGAITVAAEDLGGALAEGTYDVLTYGGALGGSPTFVWSAPTASPLVASFDTATAGRIRIILTDPRSEAQKWTDAKFGAGAPAETTAATADPDGDGLPNLLEYALGGEPLSPGAAIAPAPGLDPEEGRLTLSFSRVADPALIYEVEAANSLGVGTVWEVIWSSTGAANASGPVIVEDTVATTAGAGRFLRLRVRLGTE